jgi:hypothetical protein
MCESPLLIKIRTAIKGIKNQKMVTKLGLLSK